MVPVAHGVQAFADEVRRAVALYSPHCIAVELPRSLAAPIRELVGFLPEIRLLAYRVRQGEALMIPGDPCDSLIEAVRLAGEHGLALDFADTIEAASGQSYQPLPDDAAVTRLGVKQYAEECFPALPRLAIDNRERIIAARLLILTERHERVLFVGGLGHYRNLKHLFESRRDEIADPCHDEPVPEWEILPVRERQLGHVLREVPYSAYLYDNFRAAHGPEDRFPMLRALEHIARLAADQYREEYDEEISLTEWRSFFQYGRNLSLVRGMLRPRLYELLAAAKGCIDDDYGAIFLEAAVSYPPNAPGDSETEAGEEESDRLHRSLDLHCNFGSETCRLQHAYPYPELREHLFEFRRRRPTIHEKMRWKQAFASEIWLSHGICSWPPEDVFIENFFRTIRHRAFQQISEEHTTSEEFTSSVLDGLDIRETMRRWHEQKIIVKRERIPPGKIGPVVLIWRDLPIDAAGIWRTCLYAENQNESDIAIYAKPLGQEMAGPGISRTEYYGILSVYPARGILDIWQLVPFYFHRWKTCARLLLAAGIMQSEERYVAYVAKDPPDAELRSFARQNEKAIIYLPIGMFSKAVLKRARQCHILASHEIRQWAGDYIPKL